MYQDMYFEWDDKKNLLNILKHGISFEKARDVFLDPNVVYIEDALHSKIEKRYYALGLIDGEVLTVRFTQRGKNIRIFGAGRWRRGTKRYYEEQKSNLH